MLNECNNVQFLEILTSQLVLLFQEVKGKGQPKTKSEASADFFARRSLRGHVHMTSAKFSGILHPLPSLSAFWTNS